MLIVWLWKNYSTSFYLCFLARKIEENNFTYHICLYWGLKHIMTLTHWMKFYLFGCLFIYLFVREGQGVRKRGRETLMCERYIDQVPLACLHLGIRPATQACTLTGNWTSDFSAQRPALNPLSHTSQGWAFFKKIMGICFIIFSLYLGGIHEACMVQ